MTGGKPPGYGVGESVLIGYFPRQTARRPDGFQAPHIREICSASECISKGPPGWIDAWRHNGHWLYDSPEIAASVIPDGDTGFELYAFRQLPARFEDGAAEDEAVSAHDVVPLPDAFEFLGFDAVSRSGGNAFECSPLSCNHGAESIPCNANCLFETIGEAVQGAKEFSSGGWEPGPYYVVEVFRQRRAVQDPSA